MNARGQGKSSFDVVVIGGGIAGAIAALVARKAGKSVACVAKAPGATALSSGAIDPPAAEVVSGIHHPSSSIQDPATPSQSSVLSPRRLEDALSFAREAFPSLGLTSGSRPDGSLVLPTVLGTWKTALMALSTQAAADLDAVKDRRLVVVRFADVESAAWRTGAELSRQAAGRFGVDLASVQEIEVELLASSRRLGVFEAAAALDGDKSLAAMVGERVSRKLADRAGAVILLEPVMGLSDFARVMREVAASAGAQCAEMLATVPSVPGRRWQSAIDSALSREGVMSIRAHAATFGADGQAVTSLRVAEGPELSAKAFVLATGRFVGGGIRRDAGFSEPLFGLPVFCAGASNPDVPIGDLVGRRISDRHAAFSAGIRVDDLMRPVGKDGGPAFGNVHAAGAVTGDLSIADGPSGMGHAILSGYLAGRSAAAHT